MSEPRIPQPRPIGRGPKFPRWLATVALAVIGGLAAIGLAAALWFAMTPNDAILRFIETP